jgi:hypothetical protein
VFAHGQEGDIHRLAGGSALAPAPVVHGRGDAPAARREKGSRGGGVWLGREDELLRRLVLLAHCRSRFDRGEGGRSGKEGRRRRASRTPAGGEVESEREGGGVARRIRRSRMRPAGGWVEEKEGEGIIITKAL